MLKSMEETEEEERGIYRKQVTEMGNGKSIQVADPPTKIIQQFIQKKIKTLALNRKVHCHISGITLQKRKNLITF